MEYFAQYDKIASSLNWKYYFDMVEASKHGKNSANEWITDLTSFFQFLFQSIGVLLAKKIFTLFMVDSNGHIHFTSLQSL